MGVAKVDVKAGMASLSFKSCLLFANECHQIENEDKHIIYYESRVEETKSFALSSVLAAVATLEAYINEFYQDVIDRQYIKSEQLTEQQSKHLEVIWPDVESFKVLKKYQVALTGAGKDKIPKDREPYQSANSLIRLRNAIVHFKPEWESNLDQHQRLEKDLSSKFKPNQLSQKAPGKVIWFPAQCLGAGCAHWACDTVESFIMKFCETMKIHNKLASVFRY